MDTSLICKILNCIRYGLKMSVTQFGKISLQLDTVHPFKALCRSLESSDVLLESKRSPSNTDGLLFSPGFLY